MNRAPQPEPAPAGLSRVTRAQVPGLAKVLARAFARDPIYDWLIPSDARHATRLEWMFELLLGRFSAELCETYTTPTLDSCAIWKPPADYTLSFVEQVKLMPAFARIIGWPAIPRGMKLMQHVDALHARWAPEPHVYLYVLGVDPAAQGRGRSGQLLEPMLERCDGERRDVYLETAKAHNVPLYERHGFALCQMVEHPQFPTLWAMKRSPR